MKKQPITYIILAMIGSALYTFRLRLEELQEWIDLQSGKYWRESL